MRKVLLYSLLIAGLVGVADNEASAKSWSCFTAKDATARKQQVEQGMLPGVVFIGETQPSTIATHMSEHQVPALSVAVIRAGQLDWTAAWGALAIGGAPAGCDTLFQAGSIAKPVTLLAAMRMKQAGRLDFDKNIETYLTSYHLLPGKQTEANPVTFRNLFEHTSGITPGGYLGYAQGQALPSDPQIARAEPPSNSRKVEVLDAPGAALNYSGGGYTVAEIALQDTLHAPFEKLMREWVLAPVGMREADFTQPLPADKKMRAARGHRPDGSAVPDGWNNYPEQAAAGLWATPSDLAAFLIELRKAYLGKSKIFRQATIRELLATPVEGNAYGFRLIGEGERVFITHYGGTVGYNAGMTINLETGDGAVYMANSENGLQLGPEFLASVSRTYGWPTFREERVTRTTQPAEVLASLSGDYEFPDQGWKVSVVYEHKAPTIVFPNGDRYALTPIQGVPLEFIHPDTGVHASFEHNGDGMDLHLYGQVGHRK